MKKQLLFALGMATVLVSAAQASQEQLAASIKEARLEATRAGDQLKATLDALNTLTKQKEGDLRPAYDKFAAEIPKTEAAADWTRARVKWMEGDGQKYFQTWQQNVSGIANESLQKKAQKRLDAARKNYDKLGVALKASAEKFQPFLSDLADIKKTLASDVTAGGIKAVRSTVSNANWHHQSVNSAIKSALKTMAKMEQALSPAAK